MCQITVLNFDDRIDFKCSLYFAEYSTVLADKCFSEIFGKSKKKVKKVMWSEIVWLKVIENDSDMLYFKYSYDNDDYKKCKFKKPIWGMLKWTEQQGDKSISLQK